MHLSFLRQMKHVLERAQNNFYKTGNGDRLTSDLCFYKMGYFRNEKKILLSRATTEEERKEIEDTYNEKEIILMVLGNSDKRKEYNRSLIELASVKVQEKREENRLAKQDSINEEIEKRRLQKAEFTRLYMYRNFDDCLDIINNDSQETPDLNQINKMKFNWQVKLYPKRREIFNSTLTYPIEKAARENVVVCSYGSFSYQELDRKDDSPIYENTNCEIIGIHKTDIDGNRKDTFLIAQSLRLGYFDKMKRSEIKIRTERGERILIVKDYKELQRELETEKENLGRDLGDERKVGEEALRKSEKVIMKLKNVIFKKRIEEQNRIQDRIQEIRDGNIEEDVFVFKREPIEIDKAQKKRLLYGLFSDIMIDKAIKENFRYIGAFDQRDLKFDLQTRKACMYASQRPGRLIDSFGSTEVKNIGDVFKILKFIPESENTKKDVQFPSFVRGEEHE